VHLLNALLPAACAGCGAYGAIWCRRCDRRLRPPSRFDDRFVAPDPAVVVGDGLEAAVAAFSYGGPLRHALAALKYRHAARVAEPLARRAAADLGRLLVLVPGAPLVPIPVHPSRLRERGYNQALLLAEALAGQAGLRVADILERRRPTAQMHRLDRGDRLRNLHGAFGVWPGRDPPPDVILVDDILTTSATLEACARALRAAGARRVLGFAIAREI
jgi:ComF family protein